MSPQFAEPIWLTAGCAVLIALALLFIATERRAWRRLQRFAAPGLVARLTASHSRHRLWFKHGLLMAGVLLLSAALARPQWGADWEKAETRGIDIMIALDTSRSMLAEDISPNRLERSKLAILDLLESVRGDRVGLIAFAGNAFLQCPLTLDYQAFRQTLAALDTDSIPVGGTDVASAIDEAEAYFEKSGNDRLLILITDGEDLEASGIQRAREAGSKGTRILTVGVGSTSGELIPITTPEGGRDFLRDASGKPVSTALDEATLKRIAEASDGLYAPLGPTGSGLQRVYEFSLARGEDRERQEMLQRIPIERYQWPLLAGILLLLIESVLTTRRTARAGTTPTGALVLALLVGGSLFSPQPAQAGPASEAAKAYVEGRYEESVTLYREAIQEDPENPKLMYNLGVSAYRAGHFEDAVAQFEKTLKTARGNLQVKAFYNAGNSRVAEGFASLEESPERTRDLWQAALRDYGNALALDPDHAGALRNRDTLKKTIEEHTHILTTAADPGEAGTVTPGGPVFHRIPFPIEATAAGGWEFIAWEGDGVEEPETARTIVRLEKDATVTAQFAKTWQLEVVSQDLEEGTAGESGTYREGEPVPVKAEANDYFAFSGWTVEGDAQVADPGAAETEVTLSGNARLTAAFEPAFKLSVVLEPEIGGKAGPSGFFEEYSVVPIKAEPRPGFEWRGWTGDGIKDPDAMETTIALTADRIAIANMERVWNLVVIPVPEEGGSVEGAGDHPVGSTVDIKAAPAEGYRFEKWEGPGVADAASAETSVTVQSVDHTLYARFAKEDPEDQQNEQNQDQQQEQEQQQNQQDQQQEDQQQQQDQNRQQERDDGEEAQPDQQQQEQEGQQEQPQPEPEREEETSTGESEPQPQAGREQDMPVPGEMTREEARQLLNVLDESERFLPAGERSREEARESTPEGRNW